MNFCCECQLLKDFQGRVYGFRVVAQRDHIDSERFCRGLFFALLSDKNAQVAVVNNELYLQFFDEEDHAFQHRVPVSPSDAEALSGLLEDESYSWTAERMADHQEGFRYHAFKHTSEAMAL